MQTNYNKTSVVVVIIVVCCTAQNIDWSHLCKPTITKPVLLLLLLFVCCCLLYCTKYRLESFVQTNYNKNSVVNNNNVHLSCAHQRPERSHDTH